MEIIFLDIQFDNVRIDQFKLSRNERCCQFLVKEDIIL